MNSEQKAARIARAERHRELDLLVGGEYIRRNTGVVKGCSVGCDSIDIQRDAGVSDKDLVELNCHARVAEHDGTAVWVEELRDRVFEYLPRENQAWWHVALAKALPDEEQRLERFGTTGWVSYYHATCAGLLKLILGLEGQWPEFCRDSIANTVRLAISYHNNPSPDSNFLVTTAIVEAGKAFRVIPTKHVDSNLDRLCELVKDSLSSDNGAANLASHAMWQLRRYRPATCNGAACVEVAELILRLFGSSPLAVLTVKHLSQMRHAVGFYGESPGYRNAFHPGEADLPIWQDLKSLGFAGGGKERLGSIYFWVTDAGKELIGLPEQIAFKESNDSQRDTSLQYLQEKYGIDS